MKYLFATSEEIESIRLSPKDHAHFTNECCLCKTYAEDDCIKAILIDRRSGFDMRQYIERDYACHECLKMRVGYFDSQLKVVSK